MLQLALAPAASGYVAQLKRYPYLTDLVGTSVGVNWGTDRSSINGAVKWGKVGTESCTAHTTVGTRTAITVNGVMQYQWRASISGLEPDTEYCYRVYFGAGFTTDLLGTDASPTFRTQIPAGASTPFTFAVFGDWGKVGASGNPDQANVMSQLAQSGARFAVTTGDNAYEVGSQKDYGDLYQTGTNTSAVFGPNFWKVPGASLPLFPTLGNHDHNNSVMLTNWPQPTATATSGGRYETETYCCLNGTQSTAYPSAWYAFDAGNARFYVLDAAWDDSNSGSASVEQNDYDNHWTPTSDQFQWLANDLATHPRQLKFAFWHFPTYSDNAGEGSDTYLQGAASLEGLLKLYDVTLGFSGHAHSYQRFTAPTGGIPTYATGGGGASLDPIGTAGCSAHHAYGLGWNSSSNSGSACGSAPIPDAKERVFHFMRVNVNGPNVTVTGVDELGREFDQVTYNVPPPNADLSLTKQEDADPALAGQPLTYTLTVENDGPSTAIGTEITDDLPAGVTFESATPSQGQCDETAGSVNCAIGTLASGASATVELEVRSQAAGTLLNEASTSSAVNDPNTSNNQASTVTTVDPAADLSLQKSGAPDPLPVGQVLTYTLAAANDGPSTATGVQVVDTLAPDLTYQSATPSQGSCNHSSGTVTCSLGSLASGANATIEIEVVPQSSGTVVNQATIGSGVADPDLQNNTATAETTVDPSAGLSLDKDDAPDPALAGQPLTYTLTAHNAGPLAASAIELADTLPAGVTFDSATPSQGTCSPPSGGAVSCSLGTLAPGQDATVEIIVIPQAAGPITNQATVSSATFDPDLSDNSASADTQVAPAADLSLAKVDTPDPVLAGQPLTYSLTIDNAGPSNATGVELTDTLPAGVQFQSAQASQGSCTEDLGTVTCSLDTIASGAAATVDVVVERNATGSITNQASVTSELPDPDLSDNAASAETSVTPAADLALTKTGEPDPVLAGTTLTYALEVVNTGPQSGTGVQLTDTMPAGVTFESAAPSQGTCSPPSSGTLTCGLGTILSGQSATVEIKVRPQNPGSVLNQATVSSDVTDPHPQNNDADETTTVESAADLSLTKGDSPDPVSAGQLLTYSLTAHNDGPSSATGVQVADTLPANVTFDSAIPSQGTCSPPSSGVVNCALGTLAAGANATISIKVRPQAEGSITNSAAISSAITESDPSDNSASAETTVSPAADLTLTDADSPDPVPAGQLLIYTLTAQNAGPSSATGVQLTDTLPAGVTYESAVPTQGACNEASGTVDCALGTIASGQQATVEIKVRPQTEGSLTNDASVSSSVFDPVSADNSASEETTVGPAADLSLSKTDSPDPVRAGELLTYTLTIQNDGPSGATNVQLVDNLPAGVTYDSATPSQGSCSEIGATVTCPLGALGNGQQATVEIKVRPQGEDAITNSATVSADEFDPVTADNSASAETTVDPAADISLTKSDSPDPVPVGQVLTYTLTVANAGPSAATGVQLTDDLPAGVTFESATPSQGTCSPPSSGTVSCSLGAIDSGADATVAIEVRPQSEGSITNAASVTTGIFDPDTQNNSAGAETTVGPAADLALTKTDSPDPVAVGGQVTYTITAHNNGPSDATGVELADDLPAGVTFDSATPSQGTCSPPSSGTVSCSLGTIANGQEASVEIVVTTQSDGSITNDATVSSGVFDPTASNDSASAVTTVDPIADLSVTKSDSPDPVPAGELLTYDVTVDNAGPSAAPGVVVTDDLPAGVTYDSATPSQGSCSEDGGTVECNLGTIASGGDATVAIKVRPQSEGSVSNTVTVSSSAIDPNAANDSASAETTVDPAADLSLTKSDSPDPIATGGTLTYTLTAHNGGPSAATGVQLTDTLPPDVTYTSATPSQGSCLETSGTVDCDLGALASGADATVEIAVTTPIAGTPQNTASVSSPVFDPSAANNSASASTTVAPANHVRPKGASPLRVPLVPAYQPCTSANTTHGPPLNEPSCKPPARGSSLLTVGTPDVNGASANGNGFVLFRVDLNADPIPNDVIMSTTVNDVRCGSGVVTCGSANAVDGPDYVGELEVSYDLRLTDRFSDPTSTTPATVSDTTFPFTMPCSATSSTGAGGTCTISTTANSLVPGSARTGDRAIWQIGKVKVFDGGPDGVAATGGNTLFQTQGVFIP